MKPQENKIRVVDFFSGAGGWSEGLRQQGFEIVMGYDNWAPAVKTHNLNHSLDDKPRDIRALITQCHRHLKPGGALLLGNFTFYPDSLFLDKLLKWELIYRSEDDLRELFAPTPFGDGVTILVEQSGVNLFALAVKE
jgi:hypothetical protein